MVSAPEENLPSGDSLVEILSVPRQDAALALKAIDECADVNAATRQGFTPLMFATLFNDDPAIIRKLFEKGADPDAETEQGVTALMWSLLTETADHTGSGLPERLEREEKRRAAVLEIIRRGADVNAVCRSRQWMRWTPLLFATLNPDTNASVISELISAGADVNAQTEEDVTPLIHASAYGRSSDVVHELILAGADVNASGRQAGHEGWTPLLYALASPGKSLAIVKELARNGADVNAVTRGGDAPLFFAASRGDDPSFVRVLLDAGASPGVRARDGSTPLDCARANSYEKIVRLLVQAEARRRGVNAKKY